MSGIRALGQPLAGRDRRRTAIAAVGVAVLAVSTSAILLLQVARGTGADLSLVGEPVGSTILAALVLGELPGLLTLVGAPVVVAGILVTAREYG